MRAVVSPNAYIISITHVCYQNRLLSLLDKDRYTISRLVPLISLVGECTSSVEVLDKLQCDGLLPYKLFPSYTPLVYTYIFIIRYLLITLGISIDTVEAW